ncbi:MAG: carbon starvation CstA family protein [Armatimonadota bacterium]
MNAALLTLIMLALLGLGYVLYGRLIERRCAVPDANQEMPAHALRDGVDFEPAPPLMLFGHHFTNISGAGPIVGPIIAVTYFGWAAALGWILLGSIFIGAVHDYLSLIISARHDGCSVSEIAGRLVGKRSSVVFAGFLWLTMILIIAMFGILAAKTLVNTPAVVLPNIGLMPVAAIMGLMIYKMRVPLWAGTIFGVASMVGLLYLGELYPITLPASFGDPFTVWFLACMAYCLLASVLPIWFLETPRDYLSSLLAYAGLILGFIALFIVAPQIHAPAHIALISAKQGPIWPMLFILIACGAVSGFHCVVAGGTTVKQLGCEMQAKRIGFGSMILEAALAVQVVALIIGALFWVGTVTGADGKSLVLPLLMEDRGGAAAVFIRAFGQMVSQAFPAIGFSTAVLFGAIILNATLLDTLDTCTRLGRFVLQEAAAEKINPLKNRWISGIVTVIPACYLGLTGTGEKIWPVFGASNQLIAALALLVIGIYLVGIRRPSLYAVIPGIFMLITTVAALLYQAWGFFLGEKVNHMLGVVCLLLVALAVYVSLEIVPRLFSKQQETEALPIAVAK